MRVLRTIILVALAAAISACASSTPEFQTGPDADVTHDGLTRLDKTVMDAVWARTDIDLTSYRKVMFKGVGVEYRAVTGPYSGRAGAGSTWTSRSSRDEFQLDDRTKAMFEEEIAEAFREEISKSSVFEVVDEPGPDVLVVIGGLLDVVSRVPPETIGRGAVFIDRVGEATLVLEVRDSQTNTIFARAIDRRAAERTGEMMESNTVTNRTEVRRLGRRWGQVLRNGLDRLLAG